MSQLLYLAGAKNDFEGQVNLLRFLLEEAEGRVLLLQALNDSGAATEAELSACLKLFDWLELDGEPLLDRILATACNIDLPQAMAQRFAARREMFDRIDACPPPPAPLRGRWDDTTTDRLCEIYESEGTHLDPSGYILLRSTISDELKRRDPLAWEAWKNPARCEEIDTPSLFFKDDGPEKYHLMTAGQLCVLYELKAEIMGTDLYAAGLIGKDSELYYEMEAISAELELHDPDAWAAWKKCQRPGCGDRPRYFFKTTQPGDDATPAPVEPNPPICLSVDLAVTHLGLHPDEGEAILAERGVLHTMQTGCWTP